MPADMLGAGATGMSKCLALMEFTVYLGEQVGN